ncbi:MAG: hypothetical protein KDD51_04480 [Bdellovibrionales bacterium]|nr:hypothetical protein [Bdellovibrionales bacterium]
MQWSHMDWPALRALREHFLDPKGRDYWSSRSLLENYDLSFGERISWKWAAVLSELQARGWAPRPEWRVVDWGCGTGRALRAYFSVFNTAPYQLLDRSSLAVSYADSKIRETYPKAERATSGPYLLVLSHVLNEQNNETENELLKWVSQSEAVIWVEPGTREHSAKLVAIREKLRPQFSIVAPCPHQSACAIPRTPKAWCHNFAPVPPTVFHDSRWGNFSKELGIDLRSLPVSFLVLQKAPWTAAQPNRVLGRPKRLKGSYRTVLCRAEGVETQTLRAKEARRQGLGKNPLFFKVLK